MYSNRVLERNDRLQRIQLSDDMCGNVRCHSMVDISPVNERNVLQWNRLEKKRKTEYVSSLRIESYLDFVRQPNYSTKNHPV